MNGVILELSAVEDKIIDNKKMYSFEIQKRMSEILKIDKREELRVSNIFGEFFNESIKLEKGEKYKIRVITKTQEIFLKLQDQLFQLAINKENLVIGDGIFQLVGIITKNDTWCGEYDFDKEMKALDVGTLSFYEKVNLKIVNPILVKGKSIFGFEKILKIILQNVEEDTDFKTQEMEESILNSITIKRELYREKKENLLNDEIKKVYLGDIELVLQGYYGKMLLIFLQYVKYVGVGEFREYGFGEIISRS